MSSSSGNDDSAVTYTLSDTDVGDDPYNPVGGINAFETIEAALDQLRDGFPDYILLKRGETWEPEGTIYLTRGRSLGERMVLTTYGTGTQRPTIKNSGVNFDDADFSAVIGIHFMATKRDPSSVDFTGFDSVPNTTGFNALGGYGNTITQGILIEDCHFDWFKNNVIQSSPDNGGEILTEIIVRRNIIYNVYSGQSLVQSRDGDIQTGIIFNDNTLDTGDEAPLLYYSPLTDSDFYDNSFYTENEEEEWFVSSEEGYIDFERYQELSGDTGSVCERKAYEAPDRTIETYLDAIGLDTDMDSFVEALVRQSKYSWDGNLSADAINNYIRNGFVVE